MAEILVLTDAPEGGGEMIFSEHVELIHLESGHSGRQLLERVSWAVRDAQRAERRARLRPVPRRAPRRDSSAA
jgi:hypothetical protein